MFLRLRICLLFQSSFEIICDELSTVADIIEKIREIRHEPTAIIHLLQKKEALPYMATLRELQLKDREKLNLIVIRSRSASI